MAGTATACRSPGSGGRCRGHGRALSVFRPNARSIVLVLVRLGIADRKFFNRKTGLESCRQPARLLSASRPGFEGFVGVTVFGKYPRVLTPLPRRTFHELRIRRLRLCPVIFAATLRQSSFKHLFFRRPT